MAGVTLHVAERFLNKSVPVSYVNGCIKSFAHELVARQMEEVLAGVRQEEPAQLTACGVRSMTGQKSAPSAPLPPGLPAPGPMQNNFDQEEAEPSMRRMTLERGVATRVRHRGGSGGGPAPVLWEPRAFTLGIESSAIRALSCA